MIDKELFLKFYSENISSDLTFTVMQPKIPTRLETKALAGIFVCYALLPNSISEKNLLKSSCFA